MTQSADVSRFFSRFAQDWDELYGGKRTLFWRVFDHTFRKDIYERHQLTFEALGEDLSGKSVLDVGCGSGVYCLEAARRGASRVVGVDIAPAMIAHAAAYSRTLAHGSVCEFVCSKFPPDRAIPALKGPFDFGIVMGVMDYVPDMAAFLRYIRPIVSGSVILSFPGRHWFRAPARQYRYRLLRRCDVFTYDAEEIARACRDAGFARTELRRLDHSGICHFAVAHA